MTPADVVSLKRLAERAKRRGAMYEADLHAQPSAGPFCVDLMHEEPDTGHRWGYRVRKTYSSRTAAANAARAFRWMDKGDGTRVPVTEAAVVEARS
jgi:hypothetical protein